MASIGDWSPFNRRGASSVGRLATERSRGCLALKDSSTQEAEALPFSEPLDDSQ